MYSRYLSDIIKKRIGSGKAIVVIGPRQVGKTTLIESILEKEDYLLLDGDDPKTRTLLTEPNTEERSGMQKAPLRIILNIEAMILRRTLVGGRQHWKHMFVFLIKQGI